MKYARRVVKIFLYNKNKELLLYLRDDDPLIPTPNHWDLIGGGVEEGESDTEALKREIKEEINTDVKNIEYIGDIDCEEKNSGGIIHLLLFRGEIDMQLDKIILTEGQKLGFFKLEDISKLKISRHYLNFIEENKIIKHVKKRQKLFLDKPRPL